MSLSDDERVILEEAGGNPSPVDRQRAVGIYLAKSESDRAEAADALVKGVRPWDPWVWRVKMYRLIGS